MGNNLKEKKLRIIVFLCIRTLSLTESHHSSFPRRRDVSGVAGACRVTGAAQHTTVLIRREASSGLFVLTTDAGGGWSRQTSLFFSTAVSCTPSLPFSGPPLQSRLPDHAVHGFFFPAGLERLRFHYWIVKWRFYAAELRLVYFLLYLHV